MVKQIVIGCKECGTKAKDIIYQNSGPIVRIYCPNCHNHVEDQGDPECDIFRAWEVKNT